MMFNDGRIGEYATNMEALPSRSAIDLKFSYRALSIYSSNFHDSYI